MQKIETLQECWTFRRAEVTKTFGWTNPPPPSNQWGLNEQNILILLSFFRLGVFGYFTLLNETAPGNLGLRDIMLGRSHHLLSVSRCKTPLGNTDWQSWAHKSHFWFCARVTAGHILTCLPRGTAALFGPQSRAIRCLRCRATFLFMAQKLRICTKCGKKWQKVMTCSEKLIFIPITSLHSIYWICNAVRIIHY